MSIKSNILWRIYFCFAAMFVFGLAIVGKAYHTQTVDNGYWRSLADSTTTKLQKLEPERGNIYSSDDRLLATSLPLFNLRVDFASDAMTDDMFNHDLDSLALMCAQKFKDRSKEEYKRLFVRARDRKRRYFILQNKVDYAAVQEIKKWPLFRLGKYKGGLLVEMVPTRKNPYGTLAERTIGYVRENAQSIGIESQYNNYLAGREGQKLMRRIAGGIFVPISHENAIEPIEGKDVITTIDVNLQDATQNALEKAMKLNDAEYGTCVVMEVNTGAIKAISNLGKSKNGTFAENFNYAVASSTEPGSTFKLASYLALLDDGFIKLTDSVNISFGRANICGHTIKDDGNVFPLFRTITNAFAKSSNVAVARLCKKHYGNNKEGFYKKFKQFGLTEPTQIELKGEPFPTMSKPSQWSCTSVPWKAHGYELKLTPLQLLSFYNAVANGGKKMKPYLVQRVMDNGKVVMENKPQVAIEKIASDYAIGEAVKMLKAVVDTGTARKIRSPYYSIGGKTGTAEINEPGRGYTGKNQASFVGFFPAEAPKYSCIVVIVGPSGILTHGGDVAAPVFKEIADRIMSADPTMHKKVNHFTSKDTFGLMPALVKGDLQEIISLSKIFGIKNPEMEEVDYVTARWVNKVGTIAKINNKEGFVPDVMGLCIDDALFLLENMGLKVSFTGYGKVKSQSILPNTKLVKGSKINLILS
ncbi:MAG: transpeptidase family protein [Bacteroidetes bacterium]|nr:transpeptidase family protein [Bacteroidota bacterium]